MDNPKKLTLEVICLDKAEVDEEYVSGWGDDASQTNITGQVRKIIITKDGESQFGIRINDDGSIIITDYGHMCFETSVPQNLELTPAHPWED